MHTNTHMHAHHPHTHTHTHTAILKWFIDPEVVEAVLKKPNELIDEDQVEVCPENLPDAVLDENVDVHLVRRCFTNDAWLVIKDVTKQKSSNPVYLLSGLR